MPLSKKEQTRLRVQRYREKQSSVTQTPDNVTQSPESVTQDVTQYPAIIRALTDPLERRKLEKIHLSLKEHNVSKLVCYGYPGSGGVPFDMVGDYLETTRR